MVGPDAAAVGANLPFICLVNALVQGEPVNRALLESQANALRFALVMGLRGVPFARARAIPVSPCAAAGCTVAMVPSMVGVDRITSLPPDGLTEGASTPGLVREVAFSTSRAMLTRVQADGGVVSGWHHHGDREVHGHVLRGRVRFEFGPGGRESTDVEEGGYFHVPRGVVHRDVNPTDTPQDLIIAFVGEGPLVVNLDGPEPD